jgi:hypothetical protein
MIEVDIDVATEIIRIANSYAEELHNVLETQRNTDEAIRYIEGDIANADSIVSYIERKLAKVGVG